MPGRKKKQNIPDYSVIISDHGNKEVKVGLKSQY